MQSSLSSLLNIWRWYKVAKKEKTNIEKKTERGQLLEDNEYEVVFADKVSCDMVNLAFPKELDGLPYAKAAWQYVITLNNNSSIQLLNERHFETIKSYCITVAIRDKLVNEWTKAGSPSTIFENGTLKVHPIIKEIKLINSQITSLADSLCLTVMSELKLAKNGVKPKTGNNGGMFD